MAEAWNVLTQKWTKWPPPEENLMSTEGPRLVDMLEDWKECARCDLHKTRRNIVFGEGNFKADVLLVGEGPGEEEDNTGTPFHGESGRILDIFLHFACLSREKDLFITNVVACRAFNMVKGPDGKNKKENRIPSGPERTACWPRLEEIIYRVDPLIIVTMGKTPTAQILAKALTMEVARGKVHTATFPGLHTALRYPVLPMFHPAYLLRNQNREVGGPWEKTTSDFVLLTSILDKLRAEYYGVRPPDRSATVEEFEKKSRG